jgi:serine/tyrosine/threonine adenylyltransferase
MSLGWNFSSTYSKLPVPFFSMAKPSQVKNPELLILNTKLAERLGLRFGSLDKNLAAQIFCGNQIPEGAQPLAQAYAGHQFGHFALLGDGRALLLGEHVTPDGLRFDVQFKGSGETSFSRNGDGKAAVGPMLREYLISEAMFALGVPTTRSLAVVATNEPIFREGILPGAILTRVASSHLRVGTFQFAAAFCIADAAKALLDYTLERHFPEALKAENPALEFLKLVSERQASLVSHWMSIGFIHGVMNTDNVSISGETIDYGPCAFMDTYDPGTVFSSIDQDGRYAFGNQPFVAQWNIARLGEALLPLIDSDSDRALAIAKDTIHDFSNIFQGYWLSRMSKKIGLFDVRQDDDLLVSELLELMNEHKLDFTNTFRNLADEPKLTSWQTKWKHRLAQQKQTTEEVNKLMNQHNPAIIPRNHKVEEALSAAVNGDMAPFQQLLEALQNPFDETKKPRDYFEPRGLSDKPYKTFCGT